MYMRSLRLTDRHTHTYIAYLLAYISQYHGLINIHISHAFILHVTGPLNHPVSPHLTLSQDSFSDRSPVMTGLVLSPA